MRQIFDNPKKIIYEVASNDTEQTVFDSLNKNPNLTAKEVALKKT